MSSDTYTDSELAHAEDAVREHREWSTRWTLDTPRCIALDVLDAVAPAIAARALREAATFLSTLNTLTTQDCAEYLRGQADEIEAGR